MSTISSWWFLQFSIHLCSYSHFRTLPGNSWPEVLGPDTLQGATRVQLFAQAWSCLSQASLFIWWLHAHLHHLFAQCLRDSTAWAPQGLWAQPPGWLCRGHPTSVPHMDSAHMCRRVNYNVTCGGAFPPILTFCFSHVFLYGPSFLHKQSAKKKHFVLVLSFWQLSFTHVISKP